MTTLQTLQVSLNVVSEQLSEKEKQIAEERKKQLQQMKRDKEERRRISEQVAGVTALELCPPFEAYCHCCNVSVLQSPSAEHDAL